ncbi:MAG: M67 family metallopeptidase [Planctomycetota bacterium]|jgi:proteasome lid subunit RPN8/RPN11
MLTLKIPSEIFEQMLAQARAEMPLEACGILAGTNSTVDKLYKMTNVDQSSEHYMMDPGEQFEVARDIRAANFKMLAIYHSHPRTPARLSAEDFRLALTPGVVYIIVSLQNPDSCVMKGFLVENGNAKETPIELVKE